MHDATLVGVGHLSPAPYAAPPCALPVHACCSWAAVQLQTKLKRYPGISRDHFGRHVASPLAFGRHRARMLGISLLSHRCRAKRCSQLGLLCVPAQASAAAGGPTKFQNISSQRWCLHSCCGWAYSGFLRPGFSQPGRCCQWGVLRLITGQCHRR